MTIEKVDDIGGFATFEREDMPYTIVPNENINMMDSLELRGLYISLLMLPKNWKVHKSQLREKFSIGINKLDGYFTKLSRLGLMTIIKTKDAKGRYLKGDTKYIVHLIPRKDVSNSTDIDDHKSIPMDTMPMDTMPMVSVSYKVKEDKKEKQNKKKRDSAKSRVCENISSGATDSVVKEIFEYWKKKMGRTNKTILTETRRRKINSALKYGLKCDGYNEPLTKEQIMHMIDYYSQSEFHMENGYNDFGLILKQENITKYIEGTLAPKAKNSTNNEQFRGIYNG